MTLVKLLENVKILESAVSLDLQISGICSDTRKLTPGNLFVAVRGYESDGHEFIDEAVKKGAACIICEEKPKADIAYITVEDSRKALALVSAAWFDYPAKKMKVIGVTGTNGKTTVTTLLKCVIEKSTNSKAGLIGTSVNMIGDKQLPANLTTPESYEIQELLAMMVDEGCEYAVMEVSSHALVLSRVCGIEFEVGVFTNLSQDHLDFHGTMEAYAQAKSMLFSQSKNSAINIDDEYAQVMINGASGNVFTYAINDVSADLVGKDVKLYSDRVTFCALTIGNLLRLDVRIPGMFTVYNVLSVVSAALLLGLDIDTVTSVLPLCEGVKGRAEVVPTGRDFTILIDYAHTPDALEKIICAARTSVSGRVVTLFGCGGERDAGKRPIMGRIVGELSDYCIVTSDNPRAEHPEDIIRQIVLGLSETECPYDAVPDRRSAIFSGVSMLKQGDSLIIAGKGHETYQIIGDKSIHFDDVEVAKEALAH